MSKGMRPLNDEEIQKVLMNFVGRYAKRNRALFLLGIKSGFRISEILSLSLGNVYENGIFNDRIYVQRAHMKGKKEGRCVVLHPEARTALAEWVTELSITNNDSSTFLFKSQVGFNRPISRVQAWKMLDGVFQRSGLTGALGTHTLRKTFADRVYEKLGRDLVKTQKALAHRNINSTVAYLSFKDHQVDDAILSI